MTQTTTNNTTASATTTQQVQNQQTNSPFRKVDPVQDLLYLQKEKERASRKEKLLNIKRFLLDEGGHFKEPILDSIGVDKKYSNRVKVKFAINDSDEFVAHSQFENRAQFGNIQLSEFNSGKLDFDNDDKFGWSSLVESTMNLWITTIFTEAKNWAEYEDSRKTKFLAELSGPNGILDSENHFRKELGQIGNDLRTDIVIAPIIDDDNRLLLCTSYKGIPVRGFISNPFNFLSDSDDYGNSITDKDIEEWFSCIVQDIIGIEGANQSQQAATVETTNQATDQSQQAATESSSSDQETNIDCYALLNPEDKNGHLKGKDEKYKDFVNRIVGSIYLNNKLTDETHKEYLKFMSDDNIDESVIGYVRLEIFRLIGILIKDIHDRYRIYREFGHYWMNAA